MLRSRISSSTLITSSLTTTAAFAVCTNNTANTIIRHQSSSSSNNNTTKNRSMEPPRMPGAAPNIKIGGFADQESSTFSRVLSGGRPSIRPVSERHSVSSSSSNNKTQMYNESNTQTGSAPIMSDAQQQTDLLQKGGAGKRVPHKEDARGFRLLGMLKDGLDISQKKDNLNQRHSVSLNSQRPGSVSIGKQQSAAMPFSGRNKPAAKNDGTMFGKMKMQPLNPLYQDIPEEQMARPPPGKNRDLVYNASTRRKLQSLKFTAAQTDAIIDSFAATKWYGVVWRNLKWVDPNKVKSWKRWAIGGFCVSLFVVFGIVWYVYRNEMDLFVQMEPQDQRDFKKVIFGARMGELIPIGEEALDKADPLRILPAKEKMKVVMDSWREAGLVDKDWELEARKRKSLFAEPDFNHIFYWFCLNCGRYLIGGGYLWWGLEDEQLKHEERNSDDTLSTYDGNSGKMVSTRDLGRQKAESAM